MLTHVPCPTARQLVAALIVQSLKGNSVSYPWFTSTSRSGFLSRSTWSLGLIALWFQTYWHLEQPKILVPDFFCDSALQVVRALGFTPIFYPIDENGLADVESLKALCATNQPALLVFVHYFGAPSTQSRVFLEVARASGSLLIEDCAHCAIPTNAVGTVGDFVIFSPHKLFPVPLGAVLTVRQSGPNSLSNQQLRQFGDPVTWAQQIGTALEQASVKVVSVRHFEVVWVVKRVTQRLGIARNIRPRKIETPLSAESVVVLPDPQLPRFSRHLLNGLLIKARRWGSGMATVPEDASEDELTRIVHKRRRNASLWHEIVALLSDGNLQPLRFDATKNVPYLASYSGSIEYTREVIASLRRLGVPVSAWPDLPPEVRAKGAYHVGALNLSNSRLYLPVHHDVSTRETVKLMRRIRRRQHPSGESASPGRQASRARWHEFFSRIEVPNLLQAWEYGDAKAMSEGWEVRRYVYSDNGTDVAAAQFLFRKILGVVNIVRLSRGPVFLDTATPDQISRIFQEVTNQFSWRRASILSISPEIYVGQESKYAEGIAGLKKVQAVGAESSILDLEQELSALRSNLNPKWRNQLKKAESSGVGIKHSVEQDDFEWFEEVYKQFQREKQFRGISSELFGGIWRKFLEVSNARLFIATGDDVYLAAILIVTYGRHASYLAGWNGPKGRKLNLNNHLLWEAVTQLKALGFSKFDLGGIDFVNTPQITKFKMGMGGRNYRCVGEFIKI